MICFKYHKKSHTLGQIILTDKAAFLISGKYNMYILRFDMKLNRLVILSTGPPTLHPLVSVSKKHTVTKKVLSKKVKKGLQNLLTWS